MTDLISRQAAIDAVEMLDETDDVKNFVRNRLLAVNGDIIDRQDAIDAFCEGKCDYCYPGGCDLFRTIKAVESVPSAPQWIPCSERLPEEDVDVLVSYRYKEGEGDTSHVYIDITSYGQMYFGGNRVGDYKHWRAPFEYFESNYEVIAWMPLPEPYKEVTE